MASNLMINVAEDTQVEKIAEDLAEMYRAKGFTVMVAKMKNAVSVTFDKGTGGINMLLGMGLGIKANITVNNGTLMVSYSDGDWTGKIIGCVVGWFLCMVPLVTAIIGSLNQSKLPKEINNDIMMLVG